MAGIQSDKVKETTVDYEVVLKMSKKRVP